MRLAIYVFPPTSSSGGQRPCPCLKGVPLITAEQRSYSARLGDMITVVSQLSQSQNTQSVTVNQRRRSAGLSSARLSPSASSLSFSHSRGGGSSWFCPSGYINMFRDGSSARETYLKVISRQTIQIQLCHK